jgi:hypothetical protein
MILLLVHGTDPVELAPGVGDERTPLPLSRHGPRPVVERHPRRAAFVTKPAVCKAVLTHV